MTDNESSEEAAADNCDPVISHISNTNEDGQTQETPSNSAFNFGMRTAERSRTFADNISSTIERNWPLIQYATPSISLASLLMHGLYQPMRPISPYTRVITPGPFLDSFNVLQVLEDTEVHAASQNESTYQHHVHVPVNVENRNNDNDRVDNAAANNNQAGQETRTMLRMLQQYIPFVLILLFKFLYDHKIEITMLLALFATYTYANNNLKLEIAKRHNGSGMLLFITLCYVVACIVSVGYTLEIYTLTPYAQLLNIWDLLCYVIIMDFVLKLITIACKILLTYLPVGLLAFQRRGKYYFAIEAMSQVYRCVAPIQPYLYYLFEGYQGPEKIVGILFSVVYSMIKGHNLLVRLKLLRIAISKVFENINLGVYPSKEQLAASGGICAICHEKYSMPVRLHCKHIFCEVCVAMWLDRERSCPLCRASVTDDPIYRDGHTSYLVQFY